MNFVGDLLMRGCDDRHRANNRSIYFWKPYDQSIPDREKIVNTYYYYYRSISFCFLSSSHPSTNPKKQNPGNQQNEQGIYRTLLPNRHTTSKQRC